MKTPMRLLALIAAVLAGALAACSARAEPPVWIIRDKNSTITLFGSVHILPPGEDWRPARLKQAMREADDVWFELPLDAVARQDLNQRVMAQTFLPEGRTLSALLTPADAERLKRVASTLGQPLDRFDRMTPWAADLTLTQIYAANHGGDLRLGVEEVLNSEIPREVPRRAFESAGQQVAHLADAPQADQVKRLSETLRTFEEEPDDFSAIVGFWTKGDVAGLIHEALDPLRETLPGDYDRLVRARNAAWVLKIIERLSGSGETMMVVGVGPLVGPDSLPAMLRARGMTVEGP